MIGIVRERLGESYRVDIGSSQPATLSALAFEGATKRNRPNLRVPGRSHRPAPVDVRTVLTPSDSDRRVLMGLRWQVGSTVYARLALANKDMEPELVCFTAENKAGGYGELEGGFTITTSLAWAQRYVCPDTRRTGRFRLFAC